MDTDQYEDDQLAEYENDDDADIGDALNHLRTRLQLDRADIQLDQLLRQHAADGIPFPVHYEHARQHREAVEDAERRAVLHRARRFARYQRAQNAALELQEREQRRKNAALSAGYENERANHAAAAQEQARREAERRDREARRIAHEQAMIEADRDPIAAHDAMMRDSLDPVIAAKYAGPYDRLRSPLVSRSGELAVIHKTTENPPLATRTAIYEAPDDDLSNDAFLRSCEDLNVDPFVMDVI
jgi:hypothetical protein